MASKDKPKKLIEDWKDIALSYIKENWYQDKTKTIALYNGVWYTWNGASYQAISEDELYANLGKWMYKYTWLITRNGKKKVYRVGSRFLHELSIALKMLVCMPSSTVFPTWINTTRYTKYNPTHVTCFNNILLDTDTMTTIPSTPKLFTLNSLPFNYDTKATCPLWIKTIKEWSKKDGKIDNEWISSLQEWFGYNLTPDISQHKFMLLYGPPRSGKSTAIRILQQLLGETNYCTPTLQNLGSNFGMETAHGKIAMLVSDAHAGRGVDRTGVMESIARIVGEDSVDINRKYKPILAGQKLKTKITITTNSLLYFPDPNGKMASRLLVLPFMNSYLGKEDTKLTEKLSQELPGICNWVLKGLQRVYAEGFKFEQAKAGESLHNDFADNNAPFASFVKHKCVYPDNSASGYISVNEFVEAFERFLEKQHIKPDNHVKPYQLKEAFLQTCPKVIIVRKGKAGQQKYHYAYISLKSKNKKMKGMIESLSSM